MKLTANIVAGLMAAALAVGCAAGRPARPAPAQLEGKQSVAGAPRGPVSILDLSWATPGLGPRVAEAAGEEMAPSERLSSPEAYSAAQRGRVTTEAIGKLPPLPDSEVWRPEAGRTEKPELTYDPSLLKTEIKPPVPGVEEAIGDAPAEPSSTGSVEP